MNYRESYPSSPMSLAQAALRKKGLLPTIGSRHQPQWETILITTARSWILLLGPVPWRKKEQFRVWIFKVRHESQTLDSGPLPTRF